MFGPLSNIEDIAVKVTKAVLAEVLPSIIDPMVQKLDRIIELLEQHRYDTIDNLVEQEYDV